jgi:tetratricopeptide (TPR) repeat protein
MKALKISPNDTKVLFELAMAYYYKGKINEAIDIFSQITSFPIQDVNIHQNTYNNLGSLYYKKGLFKEAFSCFSKTIQLNPNNIYAQQMQKACQKFLD